MNGDVDLDRITYELEEMKAKGMSGAEIWDIGVIRPHPEEKVPAGPPFLGPESLKAVNHAIEQDTSQDWTDTFVEEFRERRGYDPIPYLPALKGKSFSDPLLTSRFRQDYRKTVSDLWIDGHYRASTKFLNSYGMQLVAEGGHGG